MKMLNLNMRIAIKGDLGSFKCSNACYLLSMIEKSSYFFFFSWFMLVLSGVVNIIITYKSYPLQWRPDLDWIGGDTKHRARLKHLVFTLWPSFDEIATLIHIFVNEPLLSYGINNTLIGRWLFIISKNILSPWKLCELRKVLFLCYNQGYLIFFQRH